MKEKITAENPEKAVKNVKELENHISNISVAYIDTTYNATFHINKIEGNKYDLISFLENMEFNICKTVNGYTYDGIIIKYNE